MLDYWRRLAADEECGGGLRVNVAYKHAGRIHSKNGFICGTAWRSLHTNLFLYSKHRNGAVCSFFFLLEHLLRFEEQGVRRGLRIARPKSRSA